MAYENSALPRLETPPHIIGRAAFDKIVGIEIDGEWLAVADPTEALHLLLEAWPASPGPSYRRAVAACEAAIHEGASLIGARASLSVAAMEAGARFDLFDDQMAFLEFQVAAATVADVRHGEAPA